MNTNQEKHIGQLIGTTVGHNTNGKEAVGFEFLIEGGGRLRWIGYLTEAAAPYTIDALRKMGWDGKDPDFLAMRSTYFELVVENKVSEKGTPYRDVKFVNPITAGLKPVPPEQRKQILARYVSAARRGGGREMGGAAWGKDGRVDPGLLTDGMPF